ncbi:MAG: helix-turn-helix domain-containing protein [Lachnospiraceae bacterium]|nr:helix-turn-helix domain-containing protein [Lachnospiraceae bacterium]
MPNKSDIESNIRIGKLLQIARESRKMSQAALAKQIGMSTNHISAIERGASKASIDTL